MNNYKLLVMICEKETGKNLRTKDVFVETNLNLVLTTNLFMTEEKNWSKSLKKISEKLDVKIGSNEIVCNIAVFSAPKNVFQKIVIEEEPKKFRVPEKYDVYQVLHHEYLIRANDHEYIFNKQKNTIKKLKLKYSLPDNIFRMEFDIHSIPKNVKYVE